MKIDGLEIDLSLLRGKDVAFLDSRALHTKPGDLGEHLPIDEAAITMHVAAAAESPPEPLPESPIGKLAKAISLDMLFQSLKTPVP